MGNHALRRNDLFLIRLWSESACNGSDKGKAGWRGKVQRVVDGESYRFDDWSGLVDVLTVMLTGGESTSGPRLEKR